MLNVLGSGDDWSDLTLGDIGRSTLDAGLWAKVAVLLLAVGATRLYFGHSVPTAIPFRWPAPKVCSFTSEC